MRRLHEIKNRARRVLAAAMVITMVLPATPAYAVNYRDPVTITFDFGDSQPGPANTNNGYVGSGLTLVSGNKYKASGNAGYTLLNRTGFTGVSSDTFGSGARPQLPKFSSSLWAGYEFDGWYDSTGKKQDHLTYAFPYEDTTYTAKWIAKTTDYFTMTVKHLSTVTDSDGNPIEFMHVTTPGDNWKNSRLRAGDPVTAAPKTTIPGYKISTHTVSNQNKRMWGETTGNGSLGPTTTVDAATGKLTGTMPNDDLTLTYKYVPNPDKTFKFRVEYKLADGTQVAPARSETWSAETQITAAPVSVVGYLCTDAAITAGDTDELSTRGVYGISKLGYTINSTTKEFTGRMPNQPVTLVYTYGIDPDHRTNLKIQYRDAKGEPFTEYPDVDEGETVQPNTTLTRVMPMIGGCVYPPNRAYAPQSNFKNIVEAEGVDGNPSHLNFKVLPADSGVTNILTFTYADDTSQSDYWASISYTSGQHGSISGAVKTMRKRTPRGTEIEYTIDDLTALVTSGDSTVGVSADPVAENYYVFDGWYYADALGTGIAQGSGEGYTEPLNDGIKLTGANVTDNNNTLALLANFKETDGAWHDLTFTAGEHGSISGPSTIHVAAGVAGSGVDLDKNPEKNVLEVLADNGIGYTADTGYEFDGWYPVGGNGARLEADTKVTGDATYIARFVPIGDADYGCSVPDGEGSIDSNGSGKIVLGGANTERNYVLTKGGTLVSYKTGSAAITFSGLEPCATYEVYEVAKHVTEAGFASAQAADKSAPATIRIPALASNYRVENGTEAGTKKIVISPAAPNTEYAAADHAGTPVGGWSSSELDGLEPDANYRVVARQAGTSDSVSDRISNASVVYVAGDGSEAEPEYTVKLTSDTPSSRDLSIDSVQRKNESGSWQEVDGAAGDVSATVKEGDKVIISCADAPTGQTFDGWRILVGNVTQSSGLTGTDANIIMPAGDVVVSAVYRQEPPTPSGVLALGEFKLDFVSSPTGKFAPDLAQTDTILDSFKTARDTEELESRDPDRDPARNVTYKLSFDQSVPTEEEQMAAEAAWEDDSGEVPVGSRFPWAMKISTKRYVNGVNRTDSSASPSNATFKVIASLDAGDRGNGDYGLYEIDGSSATKLTVTPGFEDDAFTGSFTFDGRSGKTYVFAYTKLRTATIIDDDPHGTGQTYTVKVPDGATMEEALDADAAELHDRLANGYVDPLSGIEYAVSLITDPSDAGSTFGWDSDLLQRDITLHTSYADSELAAWLEAKSSLVAAMDAANELLSSNPYVSAEDHALLQEKLDSITDPAHNLIDPGATPRSTVAELEQARAELVALTEEIRGRSLPPEPDDPDDPDDPPTPPPPPRPTPGGGGGGGGGGSARGPVSGVSNTVGNNRTYQEGIDGTWDHFDPVGNRWTFSLTNGERVKDAWATILYNSGNGISSATYHFDSEGVMETGWIKDSKTAQWYYMSTENGGGFGQMTLGWHYDRNDGKWYYLNGVNGAMMLGWQKIGEEWYYLNPENQEPTYQFNAATGKWEYVNRNGHPLGSLYVNTVTPDGYHVDEKGAWIRETP